MVGQNIGKYRVLDRIGRGGMGTVYRAIDETLHREVAIKVLNTELNDPAVAKRFRAEAVTVARLNHPGIATIFELFQHEGEWLMVMEFLRGQTLEALLTSRGPLPVEEAADLCMQTLAALAHAHSLGVVHRDLKPANIMVSDAKTTKVMDFGIARVVGSEHLTSAGFMMGTPAYMAPEQVMGQDIDARADLYAIGVVLFYLVTGKLPFKGHTPFEMAQSRVRDEPASVHSIRPDLPQWLDDVLRVALARQPESRYQTAPLFRDALSRGLANLPQEIRVTSEIPAELMVTAAPGSMRVPTLAAPSVAPAPVQTAAGSEVLPVVPPAPAPVTPGASASVPVSSPASVEGPAKRSGAGSRLGVAAAVLVLLGVGGWLIARTHAPERPAVTAVSEPAPATSSPGGQFEPAPAAPPAPESPAPPAPPAPDPDPSVAAPPVPAASAPVASATGRTTNAPARGASAPVTPPVAAMEADAPMAFKDLRVLIVTGKKAEERQVVLNFGGGQVTAAGPRDGVAVQALAYRDISYAVYTRAKDPKWSVVLAAPPSDVDLPGGLFRSARHWLTLQSRTTFMIIRLNDNDWKQVIATIAARTGVPVEQLSGNQ